MTDNAAFDDFILNHFGTARHHTTEKGQSEIIMDCPKCGAQQRCCLNPQLMYFNCYRCGGGKLMDWLNQICGMNRGDAFRLLQNRQVESLEGFDHLIDQFMSQTQSPIVSTVPGEGIAPYVNAFLPVGSNIIADIVCKEYIEARGFSLEYAASWGLMYADHQTKFHDRLIFPCWENGTLVYFQGRTMIGAEPKYFNPSTKDGCDRNTFMWNIDVAAQYPKVYIIEGSFNGMSIGPNVASPFGKAVSEHQLMKMREKFAPGTEVVFAFDHGAESQAYDAAVALSGSFRTSLLLMPDKRDLNDWFKAGGSAAVQWLLEHNQYAPEDGYFAALSDGRIKPKR